MRPYGIAPHFHDPGKNVSEAPSTTTSLPEVKELEGNESTPPKEQESIATEPVSNTLVSNSEVKS